MEPFYVVVFGALAATAASFELTKGKTGTNYTLVYALMMGKAPYWRAFFPSVTARSCCTG